MYTVREVMKMYNILVCDDDKAIVEAIEIYLSQEGYHILKAYDGEQALKIRMVRSAAKMNPVWHTVCQILRNGA